MNDSTVPDNSASEIAHAKGTDLTTSGEILEVLEESASKSDEFKGSNIITIGKVLDDTLTARYVPVSSLWTITPGNYPLSHEQLRECTGVRFEGEILLNQVYALGSVTVYRIQGEIGSHVIIVREDVNGANSDRAIYCNSFNTTCYILKQYEIALAELYRNNVLEFDQVLNTNFNRSLLQEQYSEKQITDIAPLDLHWHTEYYPTLYVYLSSLVLDEQHGYTQYKGRIAGLGEFSTKVLLVDRNGNFYRPELDYLNNIIELSVTEKNALSFLGCSITNNKYFEQIIDVMKAAGRKEYDFTTFNIDFFAVYVKLNLEESPPTITRMVLAPDLPVLENYLYQSYNPDYLGEKIDNIN
ncbi:TPA: hypothetical protein MW242_003039 [Acinetobacter baumannii]|nr:hypothetical protein [Acinetobacter baumannii]